MAELTKLGLKGSDIASAGTITPDGTKDRFDVTGTTGITTINTDGRGVGARFYLRFTGAVTITNSSGLALASGADVTTAAGDVLLFEVTGTNEVRQLAVQGPAVVGSIVVHKPADGDSLMEGGTAISTESNGVTSSGGNNFGLEYAFDENSSNGSGWYSGLTVNEGPMVAIGYDRGAGRAGIIQSLKLRVSQTPGEGCSFVLEGSNDATAIDDGTWEEIETQTLQDLSSFTTFALDNTTPYQLHRVRFTNGGGGDPPVIVNEVAFLGDNSEDIPATVLIFEGATITNEGGGVVRIAFS